VGRLDRRRIVGQIRTLSRDVLHIDLELDELGKLADDRSRQAIAEGVVVGSKDNSSAR